MATKNDLFAFLTAEGCDRGYCTIPEFFVGLPDGRTKKIDLVWATRRTRHRFQNASNLEHWRIAAAFEVEGCNVRCLPNEFNRHVRDFPHVQNVDGEPMFKFVVLYTAAFDRAWRAGVDREEQVASRLQWETGGAFQVAHWGTLVQALAPVARRRPRG